MILTTLPVLGEARTHLAGPLRTAMWVRVKAPVGPLDVVATHLASGSDDRPCDSNSCPPPCHNSDTLKMCQGRQAADILDAHRTAHSIGLLVGDLNAKPKEPTISAILGHGYVDTFLSAGNHECVASTGDGCTSGRRDVDLSDLTNPASHEVERIDYVFLATKRLPGGPPDRPLRRRAGRTTARRSRVRVGPHGGACDDLLRHQCR